MVVYCNYCISLIFNWQRKVFHNKLLENTILADMAENYRNVLVIGIGGVTCGGKTTLATQLCSILPNCKVFTQDDYFLDENDPRHTWIPELNHINFDILSSLDMVRMHQDILNFIASNNMGLINSRKKINASTSNSTKDVKNARKNGIHDRIKKAELNILIIEGFSIFNYKPILNLFHLKYYFVLSKEECRKRREKRVYEPPDCPGYFDKCAWPEHLAQLDEVRKHIRDVTYFDEHSQNMVEQILGDILSYL